MARLHITTASARHRCPCIRPEPEQVFVPGARRIAARSRHKVVDRLDNGSKISMIAIVQGKDQGAIVLTISWESAAFAILQVVEKLPCQPHARLESRTQRLPLCLAQPQRPEVIVQHEPVVIHGVLRKCTIVVNQIASGGLQNPTPALTPAVRIAELGKQETNCPEPHAFTDAVIIRLTQSIVEICFNASTGHSDHLRQPKHPRRRCRLTFPKPVEPKTPSHHAQANFLPTLPVGPLVRRIVQSPTRPSAKITRRSLYPRYANRRAPTHRRSQNGLALGRL